MWSNIAGVVTVSEKFLFGRESKECSFQVIKDSTPISCPFGHIIWESCSLQLLPCDSWMYRYNNLEFWQASQMKGLKIIKHTSKTGTPMIRPLYIRETEYNESTGQDSVCCGWDASPQGDGHSQFC